MKYEEALNKIENFMIKSGIREFCTETCQGYCCDKCYTSKNACHKNEGRRLSCSAFICLNLRDLIFNRKEMQLYLEMERMITHELLEIIGKNQFGNIYYHPHNKKTRDKFYIEDQFLDILDKIDSTKIKGKLRAIKNMHVVLSRFLVRKLNSKGKHGTNRRK